jgi:hypothetical protein
MKPLITLLALSALFTISCNKVKETAKETVNKGGEAVGQTATEFFEGVSEGVESTLQCELSLSQDLQNKGLKTGKFSVTNDTAGNNNKLTLYLIFDKDFKAPITAKAFDKNGLEIGRSKLAVEGKAGDAGYYDFMFDKRTYIEVKSKITIE